MRPECGLLACIRRAELHHFMRWADLLAPHVDLAFHGKLKVGAHKYMIGGRAWREVVETRTTWLSGCKGR